MDILLKQYQERTIILMLLSAVIGGLVGASLKLIFEVILAGRYTQNREAKIIIDKYTNPIVRSADSLRGRIVNLLKTTENNWCENSEYYRISTYYVFCSYFAWVQILFGNLLKLKYTTSRRNRQLNTLLTSVDKAFNNQDYFVIATHAGNDFSHVGLPKFICEALGEINVKQESGQEDICLDFSEFYHKYNEDKSFREWVENLDVFLKDLKNEYGNSTWDRLHLIELSLIALTNLMDPRHEQSKSYTAKNAQFVFGKIYGSGAKETLARDIIAKNLPIVVEPLKKRLQRRIKLLRQGSGRLTFFQDKSDFPKNFWEIHISGDKYNLLNNHDRRRMYEYLEQETRNRSQQVYFGGEFKVILSFRPEVLPIDVLERIPHNIAGTTEGRVKAADVFWKSIASDCSKI